VQDHTVVVPKRVERGRHGFARLVEESGERCDGRGEPVLDEVLYDLVVEARRSDH
jgi:hypothetical protein